MSRHAGFDCYDIATACDGLSGTNRMTIGVYLAEGILSQSLYIKEPVE
jgi:hypothetical protein